MTTTVTPIAGCCSGGASTTTVPSGCGVPPSRLTAAARTASGGAARRCDEGFGTRGMLRVGLCNRPGGIMAKLSVGDKAPAFALKDQHGKTVRLSGFKGRPVVVYFYPKADTPGCTQQSCHLRDAFPQLKKLKAVVVGISPDPPEKQKKF